MEHLNAQQLAFLLQIKKQDARAKMCAAWASSKGIENTAYYNEEGKLIDDFPNAMPVDMLEAEINANLVMAVSDIESNYLTRAASKKWILCDFPEKQIEKFNKANCKKYLNIPPALKSMLPTHVIEVIRSEWLKRYPKYTR